MHHREGEHEDELLPGFHLQNSFIETSSQQFLEDKQGGGEDAATKVVVQLHVEEKKRGLWQLFGWLCAAGTAKGVENREKVCIITVLVGLCGRR